MKKYCFFIVVIVLLITVASCKAKPKSTALADVPTEATDRLVCDNVVYTRDMIDKIASFEGTEAACIELYPTPYIREYKNGKCLFYYSDESVVGLHFDQNGNRRKLHNEVHSISILKENFEPIEVGTTLDDVMILDPNGDYSAFYASGIQLFQSKHYTSDNYLVWIYYDETFLVERIEAECLRVKDGTQIELILG